MEEIENKNNNEENIGLKLEEKNIDANNSKEIVEKAEIEDIKMDNQNIKEGNNVIETAAKTEKADFGETRVFKVIRDSDLDMQSTRRMVIDKELLKEKTENENVVSRKKEFRSTDSVNGEFTEEELEDLLDIWGYETPLYGMLQTGDEVPIWVWSASGIGSLSALLAIFLKKKKH